MSEKKYNVIISDRALQMLKAHIRYLAQGNKDSAKDKKNDILMAIRSLEYMPQRYPFFQEIYIPSNKYHKMYVAKWYLIIYQIKDNKVYVDYILDCRKEYSWFIK